MLEKTSNKIIAVIVALVVAVGVGYFIFGSNTASSGTAGDIQATLYKSPTCSCCLGHAGYLKGEGFNVKTVLESDISSIKQKHNIPYDMQSCHTTEIEGYFVEGHVPIEAVNKLLAERPEIDGITLPNMPSGSPGLPGPKREEFVIYALKGGESSEFMRI